MAEPITPERRADIKERAARHRRRWAPPEGSHPDTVFLDLSQLIDVDLPDLLDALETLTAACRCEELGEPVAECPRHGVFSELIEARRCIENLKADQARLEAELNTQADQITGLLDRRTKPEITPTIAAHVLYRCGEDGGYATEPFTVALIDLIGAADTSKRALLFLAFPAHVRAVNTIEATPTGVAELQAIAAAGETP